MEVSYTRLSIQAGGYQEAYEKTSENSIVYFQRNPVYLYGSDSRADFFVVGHDLDKDEDNLLWKDWRRWHLHFAEPQVIKPESIKEHGWIVSGATYRNPYDPVLW